MEAAEGRTNECVGGRGCALSQMAGDGNLLHNLLLPSGLVTAVMQVCDVFIFLYMGGPQVNSQSQERLCRLPEFRTPTH